MQSRRSRPRLHNQADWDNADRFGKILISLMEPGKWPLNDRDETFLNRMRQVWAIMVENGSQRTRVKLISEAMDINERAVKALMDDATHLFGDLLTVDAIFEKSVIAEKYWSLHEMAMEYEDYEGAAKMLDRISNLRGYNREDGGIKREDLVLPEVTFTSNPKALSAQPDESEEIEYEHLDLLESEASRVLAGEGTD